MIDQILSVVKTETDYDFEFSFTHTPLLNVIKYVKVPIATAMAAAQSMPTPPEGQDAVLIAAKTLAIPLASAEKAAWLETLPSSGILGPVTLNT